MIRRPLLSVVTACYNNGHFLAECLASVARQSTREIEHLVVLDGCTDESAAVVEKAALANDRLMGIVQPHAGISAAYNTAFACARAELVLKVDADDTIEPTYVEEILRAHAEDPRRNVIFSWCHLFGTEDRVWQYPPFDRTRFMDEHQIPGPAAMSRELWGAVGGFRNLPCAEDWDLYVRMEAAEGLVPYQIPRALWNYRQHDGPRVSKQNQEHLPALKAEWRELLAGYSERKEA